MGYRIPSASAIRACLRTCLGVMDTMQAQRDALRPKGGDDAMKVADEAHRLASREAQFLLAALDPWNMAATFQDDFDDFLRQIVDGSKPEEVALTFRSIADSLEKRCTGWEELDHRERGLFEDEQNAVEKLARAFSEALPELEQSEDFRKYREDEVPLETALSVEIASKLNLRVKN